MDKLPQHETYSDSELSLDGIGSDIESISTYTSHSRYDSRDYWLGKSYFNYLVAKSVTAAQSAACSMEDLDVGGRVLYMLSPANVVLCGNR